MVRFLQNCFLAFTSNRRRPGLVVRSLAILTIGATGYAQSLTFASKESVRAWRFSNGAEFPGAKGALEFDAQHGHAAAGALALNFDFTGGGNYVATMTDLPAEPAVKAVRLWLKKPGANLMFLRAVDAKGETFQKDLQFDYDGWQEVVVDFGEWVHSWGGDNVFDQPAKQFHLVIEGQGGVKSGTLLIDEIEWLAEMPSHPHEAVTTYVESDFTGEPHWTTSGPAGVSLKDQVWTYRFTDDQTVCGLHYGFSALAKPEAILLTLEGDGSGHEIVATFGSHFQNFARTIGTLDQAGEVTLEAPLGEMKTWKHEGGENDGIVRYPLRLLNIAVVKKGAGNGGTLKLKNVSFRTKYDTRSPVFVVPQVRALDDDLLNFEVTLRSLLAEPLRGQLTARLQTPSRELMTQTIDMIVPPLSSRTLTVPAHFGPHPMIEGAFTFASDQTASHEETVTIAKPPAFTSQHAQLDPESRMGVGMYLYRFHAQPNARAQMDKLCRLVAAAGVKWTREEFHWNWVEKKQGEYDWSFFDELVDSATAHGISIYGLVCYWTDWAKPPFDDAFVQHYCDYLRVLVARYKDRIHHWEIWNEPNIFFFPDDKARYAALLSAAYTAIKETDPTAKVLGMSTAGIDTAFIEKMTKLGVEYDDLTVHPYRHELDPLGFKAELERTSAMFGDRPIWITEMGWPSNIGGVTERQQAALVSGVYLTALASPVVRNVSWYDFREDGDDPFYNEHHFGLIRSDMTPKIGYAALAAIGEMFADAKLLDVSVGEHGLLRANYKKANGYLTVLALQGQSALVQLKVSDADDLIVRDMVGGVVDVEQHAGVLTLLMRQSEPVYLASSQPLKLERLADAISLKAPQRGMHPGDATTLRWESDAMRVVSIELPPGWHRGAKDDVNQVTLQTPSYATPGEHVVRVTVANGDATWTLPVNVRLTSPVVVR